MNTCRSLIALALLATTAAPALAWHREGHDAAARAAVALLPEEMPAFFREGADAIAAGAIDPDLFRNKLTPELTRQEAPEHFIDLEYLRGRPLPADRYAFIALCVELGVEPAKVGLLPYAVTEWTQKLTLALAQHRRRPEDPHARARCLVYAGLLAHYAGDLCQPLHTTIHFDGRVGADGRSPRSGIHHAVDDLPGRLALTAEQVIDEARRGQVRRLAPLREAVVEELMRSHVLVDAVYGLEPALPPREGPWEPGADASAFAHERIAAAARFTASLYLTAWQDSASIELPEWLPATTHE